MLESMHWPSSHASSHAVWASHLNTIVTTLHQTTILTSSSALAPTVLPISLDVALHHNAAAHTSIVLSASNRTSQQATLS
jgi:hypothetical protein